MQITRRTVLKSILGALVAPSITLDFSYETDMAKLVTEFCEKPEWSTRYDLSAPWEFAGDSVATDARALIRVPGLVFARDGKDRKVPDPRGIFEAYWREDRWQPLPREVLASSLEDDYSGCPFCERGPECVQCGGAGEWYGLDDRSHHCQTCQGNGYARNPACPLCHGDHANTVRLDAAFNVPLNIRYARLARQIPGVRWAPSVDRGPVLFRGDGNVMAMVMPIDVTPRVV